jgi:hypothetical protein
MPKNSGSVGPAVDVTVLQEAHTLINGERQDAHGDPGVCLNSIADFWSTYILHRFKIPIVVNSVDVCQMMALLKMSRELTGSSRRDNLVDQIGYLGLVGKVKYEKGGP